jgi:hypothetical protein
MNMGNRLNKNHTGGTLMSVTPVVALLSFLLLAGCTGVERASLPAPPPAEISMAGSTGQGTARTDAPVATSPATVTASPAPVQPPGKKDNAAARPRKPAASPPLDLTSLEQRLRETEAIGVFTKIALKNQVDDLLKQFRAFYQGQTRTSLAELRQPYDMLLLKVLSLLQDDDPGLARAIVASREAIWGMLADPDKFATL